MSKSETRIDPRVIRTRQMLRDALIALIQEVGFDPITVRDIAERATLNRATFYLHYRDKDDLLVKSMNELMRELETEIGMPPVREGKIALEDISRPMMVAFRHFARHAVFYRVTLCEVGIPSAIIEMQRSIETIMLRWLTQIPLDRTRSFVDPNMVTKFVSTAYIGIVRWWLENGMPHSTEHMADQFIKLISLGIFRSIGLEIPVATAS